MGFTVIRIRGRPRSEGGLKSGVRRIEERVREGPPYKNPEKTPNQDYLRQLEEVKKALRLGELERERRQALAYGPKGERGSGGAQGTGETMEDYFGSEAEDFGTLLEEYGWGRPEDISRAKEDEGGTGENEKGGKARPFLNSRPSGRASTEIGW